MAVALESIGPGDALAAIGMRQMEPVSNIHISEITTKPWSLKQDVEAYQRAGLGIELWESKFSDDNYERELDC